MIMLNFEVSLNKSFYSTNTTCSEIQQVVLPAKIHNFMKYLLQWKKRSKVYTLVEAGTKVSS